jgi:hypothetical protein
VPLSGVSQRAAGVGPEVQAVVFPTGFEYIVETLDAGGRDP